MTSSYWSGHCCGPSGPASAAVLLVDEIDRSDSEFEAFLLEFLDGFQITVPERGTIRADQAPLVIITSNRTRELHDAFKRRCMYHWIPFPEPARELEIIRPTPPGSKRRRPPPWSKRWWRCAPCRS